MYSLYGIPIPINETSVSKITSDTNTAKKLQQTKIVIIDECTMAQIHALNVIDRLLGDVMTTHVANKKQVPFEGKVLALGGDFRQCLPVLANATKAEIVDCCVKYSKQWKNFTRLPLLNNVRSTDPEYSRWLLKLRNGELSNEHSLGDDVTEIPPDMLSSGCSVTDIFGQNITINVNDTESVHTAASHAILCPKNEDVHLLSSQIMERISGEYILYTSDNSVDSDEADDHEQYPVEFLNSLTPSGMPPHRLQLKMGTIVMLLRNLNTNKGLCNGTRLMAAALHPNIIQAKVITGSAEGNIVFIPRIDLCPSETRLPFTLRRRQFPVKPAFAMTIYKSQGQSLNRVGIYFPGPAFAHGLPYVAFSGVKLPCQSESD
ncbi:ATP-dependent DNA helicase PIF1-like [Dendrobates tinctorius]|uniref:ATP-dependent DNA helicase PIF1-like n=1 Tax=Dendrobates tinctorius TaxID=92724 RepID=UPI003CCA5316